MTLSLSSSLTSSLLPEAGFLVRVHPDPCLILIRAQIRALLCASKPKLIPAQTLTLLVLDKKTASGCGPVAVPCFPLLPVCPCKQKRVFFTRRSAIFHTDLAE
jgi:hypothetical protein